MKEKKIKKNRVIQSQKSNAQSEQGDIFHGNVGLQELPVYYFIDMKEGKYKYTYLHIAITYALKNHPNRQFVIYFPDLNRKQVNRLATRT